MVEIIVAEKIIIGFIILCLYELILSWKLEYILSRSTYDFRIYDDTIMPYGDMKVYPNWDIKAI